MNTFYKQTTLPGSAGEKEQKVQLPQKIGPYKIDGLLSKGGMSILYLGLHPEKRQPLAIKVLSPQFVTQEESIGRFLKEAEIIALTNHPNIVKLYGQGQWEGGLYIAMELIRGISLRQFLTQQSLSLKYSLDILLQTAYALLHLHTHGVIHRDLKPENILITEDGEVKVIDFGIAQLHEEVPSAASKQVMGTPDYMSPEQKENPSRISYASDIYSLGIIAYELILGKLSYGMIDLSLLPKGLRKIIGKALAVSVKERYQDIVDFISDISQYLKSGELEKDRSGGDQLKELLETLQKAAFSLSASETPKWPQIDFGLARYKAALQGSAYSDFFHLSNNQFLVLIGEPVFFDPGSMISLAVFRGMVKAVIQEMQDRKAVVFCKELAQRLNQLLQQDSMKLLISLNLLLLDPFNEKLSFLSCSLAPLFHLPQGSKEVRKLSSENPPLGQDPTIEFSTVEDNWKEGDLLILPSFRDELLDNLLKEALVENALLSAQSQAENILKRLLTSPSFISLKYAKTVLSIQRLG